MTILGGTYPRGDEEYAEDPKIGLLVLRRRLRRRGEVLKTLGRADEQRCEGATGVVIDGGIGDGALLFEIEDWPVFARYTSSLESMLRYRIWDVEDPLALSGTLTSQVRLDPRSWIFGDMDGVLRIPEEVAKEVLTKAEEAKSVEDKVRAEIRWGVPTKDLEA